MKVLMQNRSSTFRMLAGDSVQMNKTREALIQLGIEVEIKTQPTADFTHYDLVHLFNIIPIEETYQFYQKRNSPEFQLSSPQSIGIRKSF